MTQKALALARQIGDRHREMRALVAIVNQRLHLNDPTWQKVGEAALELARDIGDRRHEASILVTLGKFCSWTDQPQRGMEYLEHAVPICEALDDRLTQVSLLDQLGLDAERTGDYYRLLTDYQQERLAISREIGYRVGEAQALTLCGQTRAIYLGDYEGGLGLLKDSLRVGRGTLNDMFTLLRVVQIHADLEELEEGREALARLGEKDEQAVFAAARAGLRLVMAMLYVTMGDEEHLRKALALLEETLRMIADNPLLTRQYEMAVASQATRAHLSLAELASDAEAAARHRLRALEASRHALETFEEVGFVQVIECVSEEVLFRHAQALEANGEGEAVEYVERAHEEMMRKHDLIPVDSYFRRTYLENIPLHRAIAAAHEREVA
jgi:tetratricopeptide (TPR) repeat protein